MLVIVETRYGGTDYVVVEDTNDPEVARLAAYLYVYGTPAHWQSKPDMTMVHNLTTIVNNDNTKRILSSSYESYL